MSKNKVEVIIGGHIYALQGNESKEHIQKVAALIDHRILDVQKSDLSHRLNTSQTHILAAIHLANDYIKLQQQFEDYERELEKCSQENMLLTERVKEMGLEITKARVNKY